MIVDDDFLTPFPHLFISGEYEVGKVPYCKEELNIIRFSAEIRKKPKWEEINVNDIAFLAKSESEIDSDIKSEDKFNFIMNELAYYALLKDGLLEVGPVDGTWLADKLVEESLRQDLLSGVRVLEEVQEWKKDWHPGTNQLVLDLVHPSLFLYVHGRTTVTKESRKQPVIDSENELDLLYYESMDKLLSPQASGELAFAHVRGLPVYTISEKFQWLPSDVQVAPDGTVRFSSYINNLHPKEHRELYTTIECILSKFVPLWEKVLTDLRNPRPNRIGPMNPSYYDESTYVDAVCNPRSGGEDETTFHEPPPPLIEVKLGGRTLQVIVKLVNTHLNSAKPRFPGGEWHLEGMGNERIVAIGIYYYSSENISESSIHFRQAIKEPDCKEWYEHFVGKVFGLYSGMPLNQNLGSILTSEERCIAFPNTLQHRISPFKLEDLTKPGHQKILVFFLVDPCVRILSTSQVPPQQLAWFLNEVNNEPKPTMPNEIMEKIINQMDWPMNLKEAKSHRDDLMKERKLFTKNSNDQHFERRYKTLRQRRLE